MHMNSDIANCKQFEKFLRLVTKTNILTVQRKRFTWMVSYKDAEGRLSQVSVSYTHLTLPTILRV